MDRRFDIIEESQSVFNSKQDNDYLLFKHSIASVDISMKSNTFALQNIKQRIWQAVKILNDTGTLQPGVKDKWNINCFFLSKEWYRLLSV